MLSMGANVMYSEMESRSSRLQSNSLTSHITQKNLTASDKQKGVKCHY
jgi:hypothetical protein